MKNDTLKNLGLLILRIVPSLMMITHGWPKFQRLLAGNMEFADPIGIGSAPSLFLVVIAEIVCPILVIVGFKTRWAAIPTAINMSIAAFIVHINDPIGKKELAIVYLAIFIAIALLGPGKYSVDKK